MHLSFHSEQRFVPLINTLVHGNIEYHWANQSISNIQQTTYQQERKRYDSGYAEEARPAAARMPSPVPQGIRSSIPDFIAGTPDRGWYHELDSSNFYLRRSSFFTLIILGYRMRTGAEAKRFFVKGRVRHGYLRERLSG